MFNPNQLILLQPTSLHINQSQYLADCQNSVSIIFIKENINNIKN